MANVTVTYKGVRLGKSIRDYHVSELAELVALLFKHNCNQEGIYPHSIQHALESMFGAPGVEEWMRGGGIGKIRKVAELLRLNGYRSIRDEANGLFVGWRVPRGEMDAGGIRVSRFDPGADRKEVQEEVSVAETKKTISPGLARSIEERKKAEAKCNICGASMSKIDLSLHLYREHKLVESEVQLLRLLEEHPGLYSHEYDKMMGWYRGKAARAAKRLAEQGKAFSTGRGTGLRLFPASQASAMTKEQEKQEQVATTVSRQVAAKRPAKAKNEVVRQVRIIMGIDGKTYTVIDGEVYKVSLEKV